MSSPGFGVMLQLIGGNRESVDAFSAAIGKTIASAELVSDDLRIGFDDGTMIAFSDQGQSCCEERYITCGDDLASFVGAKLIGGEVAGAPSIEAEYGEHEVQFLRLHTDRGDLVCETHNVHNGYYGGFAVRCRAVVR